ncbi:MAG: hypothetical protein ACRBM6_29735 [Geminicoccales bacterium]
MIKIAEVRVDSLAFGVVPHVVEHASIVPLAGVSLPIRLRIEIAVGRLAQDAEQPLRPAERRPAELDDCVPSRQ